MGIGDGPRLRTAESGWPVLWMVAVVVVPTVICALFAVAPDWSPLGVALALLLLLVAPPYPTMLHPSTSGRIGVAALAAGVLVFLYVGALFLDAYIFQDLGVVNIGTGVVLCLATAFALARDDSRQFVALPAAFSAASVAGLLLGVAVLRDRLALFGVAVLLFAVAVLQIGVAVLRDRRVLAGAAVVLAGLAVLIAGIAALREHVVRAGFVTVLVAVVIVVLGLTFLRERQALFAIALLLFGLFVFGEHQVLAGVGILLLGVLALIAGVSVLLLGVASLLPARGPQGRSRRFDATWVWLTGRMPTEQVTVKGTPSPSNRGSGQ